MFFLTAHSSVPLPFNHLEAPWDQGPDFVTLPGRRGLGSLFFLCGAGEATEQPPPLGFLQKRAEDRDGRGVDVGVGAGQALPKLPSPTISLSLSAEGGASK